ncbi:MAG TPA: histidine phosphatase family protein [Methylophilaceae bacterium]|nr:histidine phosphatase family protein [Methylophilaceae bacterium]
MNKTAEYKNIMLWRHADALPIGGNIRDDLSRPLSKKGRQQAKIMAAWLKRHLPKETIIISSNALRSQQTAIALTNDFILTNAINPGASLEKVLETIHSLSEGIQSASNLMIVGHQPWIGHLAAYLFNPEISAQSIGIKKAALWWFKRTTNLYDHTFDLVSVQTPTLL